MSKTFTAMSCSINDLYKSTVLKMRVLHPAEEARAMADRLFEHFFNLSPVQRVLSEAILADENKVLLIEEAISKLMHNVPLQYVIGKAFFMDMEFVVNSSVLIPRPETEELVSLVLKQYSGRESGSELLILDIGTGSGCIPIALKRYLPESEVFAIDISKEALAVATENAAINEVKINFINSDILDHSQWNQLSRFDLIVSNPPYVTNSEKELMQLNVLDHEPHTALFVPDSDPLIFYREIMVLSKIILREAGSLWFEINEMFGKELRDMALGYGFRKVNIIFDFRGKSRFLQCLK
jgi:release factor glutamine methyltransferase